MRRRSKAIISLVAMLAVIGGVASLLIVPTRALQEQRKRFAEDTARLEAVRAANRDLEARIAALQTPEEIARIARDRYNLVQSGVQILAVLPDPAPEPLPAVWPYTVISDLVTVRLQNPPPPEPNSTTATTAEGG